MKHFNVSTTSVVCSLSPFFAVFLAWLFLGEHITAYTIISVVVVILCVTMIIFGSQGEQKMEMDQNMVVVFALFCMPILLAGGMIAARKMKRNHPFSLTCYSNAVLLVTSVTGLALTSDKGYGFVKEFSYMTWFLLTLAGLNTIFEHLAKFLAFRYYRAAPLQKFNFLPNVWNFTIDILFMHADFGTL